MTYLISILVSIILMCFTAPICIAGESLTSNFESHVHDGHLCARGSAWASTKSMVLNVLSKGMQISASYDIKIYANRDMKLIIQDPQLIKGDSPGEAILVAGRALLTKNIEIKENNAIHVLDGAALFRQLVIAILKLASENGPADTPLPFHQKIEEAKYPINATTQSASVDFKSPWNAVVDLKRKDKETIIFKIQFGFVLEDGKKADMELHGHMSNFSKKNKNPDIPDNLHISKWNQYNVGAYPKKTDAGTIHGFGTTFIDSRYSTLGELRKYIQKKYK